MAFRGGIVDLLVSLPERFAHFFEGIVRARAARAGWRQQRARQQDEKNRGGSSMVHAQVSVGSRKGNGKCRRSLSGTVLSTATLLRKATGPAHADR
jgi:hypothetical protein